MDLRSEALRYARNGLFILPLKRDNTPYTSHGFKDATNDLEVVAAWWTRWPDANIGLSCRHSGLVCLDTDPRNGSSDSLMQLLDYHGPGFLSGCVVMTPGGGSHHYYRARQGCSYKGSLGPGLDVKWNGYTVLPPSYREDGEYTWLCKESLTKAPEWFEVERSEPPRTRPKGTVDEADVARALAYIDPDDYQVWLDVGMAIREGLGDEGFDYWEAWSQGSSKYEERGCAQKWRSFNRNGITLGTLFHHAIQGGYR